VVRGSGESRTETGKKRLVQSGIRGCFGHSSISDPEETLGGDFEQIHQFITRLAEQVKSFLAFAHSLQLLNPFLNIFLARQSNMMKIVHISDHTIASYSLHQYRDQRMKTRHLPAMQRKRSIPMQYDAMHELNIIFHCLNLWDSLPVDAEHMSRFILVLPSHLKFRSNIVF